MRFRLAAALALLAATGAQAAPSVIAAENVYGAVASSVAGPGVPVTSILTNPNQDPHAFELSPMVAREIADAGIVAYNGAGYDPWMTRLLAASPRPARQAIEAAALIGAKPGGNPHLWYDPRTVPAMASALAAALAAADPAGAAGYRARAAAFRASLAPLDARIAAMRRQFAGTPVTATEPVFGAMAAALGLAMRNERFQIAIMNDTEPRASDVAAMESDLKSRRVRLLFYNAQVTDNIVRHLLSLAHEAGVPVVGVTETMPPGTGYVAWIMGELDAVEAALRESRS